MNNFKLFIYAFNPFNKYFDFLEIRYILILLLTYTFESENNLAHI